MVLLNLDRLVDRVEDAGLDDLPIGNLARRVQREFPEHLAPFVHEEGLRGPPTLPLGEHPDHHKDSNRGDGKHVRRLPDSGRWIRRRVDRGHDATDADLVGGAAEPHLVHRDRPDRHVLDWPARSPGESSIDGCIGADRIPCAVEVREIHADDIRVGHVGEGQRAVCRLIVRDRPEGDRRSRVVNFDWRDEGGVRERAVVFDGGAKTPSDEIEAGGVPQERPVREDRRAHWPPSRSIVVLKRDLNCPRRIGVSNRDDPCHMGVQRGSRDSDPRSHAEEREADFAQRWRDGGIHRCQSCAEPNPTRCDAFAQERGRRGDRVPAPASVEGVFVGGRLSVQCLDHADVPPLGNVRSDEVPRLHRPRGPSGCPRDIHVSDDGRVIRGGDRERETELKVPRTSAQAGPRGIRVWGRPVRPGGIRRSDVPGPRRDGYRRIGPLADSNVVHVDREGNPRSAIGGEEGKPDRVRIFVRWRVSISENPGDSVVACPCLEGVPRAHEARPSRDRVRVRDVDPGRGRCIRRRADLPSDGATCRIIPLLDAVPVPRVEERHEPRFLPAGRRVRRELHRRVEVSDDSSPEYVAGERRPTDVRAGGRNDMEVAGRRRSDVLRGRWVDPSPLRV